MKFELTFLERGYYANILRAKAEHLAALIDERSASATAQELRGEIAYLQAQARRLDEAEEPAAVSDKEPIRVHPRRDIDAVDAPRNGGCDAG